MTFATEVNCLAYWFIAPYIRDVPHLHTQQMMSKLIPATERGTMGRAVLTGDSAFKVNVWDVETCLVKKSFHCESHVLVLAVSPFLGLIAAGEAREDGPIVTYTHIYMLQRRTPPPGHGLVMVPRTPPVDLWWLWMRHTIYVTCDV